MHTFKYDIAISLCKQDVDFARKLVMAINPSLKVFFYENNQEELVSKSGPVKFAKVFKEEARVVVILSRKEWSESFYTEIEQNAIMDRIKKGYNFLIVIPTEAGYAPEWYPTNRLYANPGKFTIEQLAKFIEFKVTEEGGEVKPITLEDRYEHLKNKLEQKKALVLLQQNTEAIAAAKEEIKKIKEAFNQKIQFLQKPLIGGTGHYLFSEYVSNAHCALNGFLLECAIGDLENEGVRVVTTQDYEITFQLYQVFGNENNRKLLKENYYRLYYSANITGWATPFTYGQVSQKEAVVLFRNRDNQQRYELKNPIGTNELVDYWFQKLFKTASADIEKYL